MRIFEMDLEATPYKVLSLGSRNIIIGKNGCGKSTLLKALHATLRGRSDIKTIRYLSPERGGTLQYEAGIEQNISGNPDWLDETRRQNQANQFRQQSAAQFRRLELLILREIEKNLAMRSDPTITFDTAFTTINSLLDRVCLVRSDNGFTIHERATTNPVNPASISSGESELISLAIECLVFAKEAKESGTNLLLLDEPDVHLHPDLQARFAHFLEDLVASNPITLIIATHSTAFLGAMSLDANARVAFMKSGDVTLSFVPIGEVHRKILPVFGAHPLSNVFNEAPVLLVEGEDDERIWQQAVRSAQGKLKFYPCQVEGVDNLASFEQEVATILQSVYDNAVGYSIRDADDAAGPLTNIGPVKRLRLACRAAENLLLSEDVLFRLGTSWVELTRRIDCWLTGNEQHPHFDPMRSFQASRFDRKTFDLKDIRNDLMGLIGSNKPWEVVVGQAIAHMNPKAAPCPDSLAEYLGPGIVALLDITSHS
jgi:energy-coupling factor transporter ATP-binding protein EcfA2